MNQVREHPATFALTASWILIYAAMNVHQGGFVTVGGMGFGRISVQTAHLFGDLTAQDVTRGQIWRTVTATFIHFSLLHLFFNLTCLISFGRLLESWYGKWQLLAVYVAIGALGNGLAVLGRVLLNSGLNVHCAGGSSVMFGFIALIAVVGWRSKTRYGDYVRRQMLGKLLLFGVVMGLIGRGVLDNYGHGGGAIAGALVGFSHRLLVRSLDRPLSRILGVIAVLILGACAVAQVRSDRTEVSTQEATLEALRQYEDIRSAISLYEGLATYAELNPKNLNGNDLTEARDKLFATITRIQVAMKSNSKGSVPESFQSWRALASAAATRFPTPEERAQFRELSLPILKDAENRVALAMQAANLQSLRLQAPR